MAASRAIEWRRLMRPERWDRINAIFDLAVDVEPAVQEKCVREAAAGDDDLAAEVLSLLRACSAGTVLHSQLAGADSCDAARDGYVQSRTTPRHGSTVPDSVELSADWSGKKIGPYRL